MSKYIRKTLPFSAVVLLGTAFALVTLALCALTLSVIAYLTDDPTALVGVFSLAALAIAGVISGAVTSRANGDGGVVVATICAVLAAVLVTAVGLIWKGGLLPLGAVLNIAVFLALSVVGALACKQRRKRGRRI